MELTKEERALLTEILDKVTIPGALVDTFSSLRKKVLQLQDAK